VTLYTSPGCGLCHPVAADLARLAPRFGFSLRTVDVSTDPLLEHRFGAAVPVVAIDGEVIAQAPIREGSLAILLADHVRRQRATDV
jgi:glutaredoxin